MINEILADPDAVLGDANGDGIVSTTNDEFVEIVNAGTAAIDLTGFTVSDATSVRHTFGAVTLNPGESVVVFGGGVAANYTCDATYCFAASTGQTGFNNTGDTVTLSDALGNVVDTYTYGAEAGDNQSIVRDPELSFAAMVKHTVLAAGVLSSPGTRVDSTPF